MEQATAAALSSPQALKRKIEKSMEDETADESLREVLDAVEPELETVDHQNEKAPEERALPRSEKVKTTLPLDVEKAVTSAISKAKGSGGQEVTSEHQAPRMEVPNPQLPLISAPGSPDDEEAPPESSRSEISSKIKGPVLEFETELDAFRAYTEGKFQDMTSFISKLQRRIEVLESRAITGTPPTRTLRSSRDLGRVSSGSNQSRQTAMTGNSTGDVAHTPDAGTIDNLVKQILDTYPDPPIEYLGRIAIRGMATRFKIVIKTPGSALPMHNWSSGSLREWVVNNSS